MPRLPASDCAGLKACIGRGPSPGFPRTRAQIRSQVRGGVTLIELLVVLVLMAISAGLALPALSANSSTSRAFGIADDSPAASRAQFVPVEPSIDNVLTNARRLAVKRGEPLRLQVASDGVWAVIALRGGSGVESGRAELPLSWLPDIVVDALGTCMLSMGVAVPAGARAWDALACRWRAAR